MLHQRVTKNFPTAGSPTGPPEIATAAPTAIGNGGKANTSSSHPYREPPLASTRPSAIDIFQERCEARAILVYACLLDLHEAVDGLQEDAERTGLVDDIGQDQVQAIMAKGFAIVPKMADQVDNINLKPHRPGATKSTLRTADYLIQQNDPARFKAWLAKHSRSERAAINKHIHGARP